MVGPEYLELRKALLSLMEAVLVLNQGFSRLTINAEHGIKPTKEDIEIWTKNRTEFFAKFNEALSALRSLPQ